MKDSVREEISNSNLPYILRISLNTDLLINLTDINRRGRETEPGYSKKVHSKSCFTLF